MAFNENTRVKIPAIITLTRLGYDYLSLKDVKWDEETNIFPDIFSQSIKEINKDKNLSDDDIRRLFQDINLELDNDDLGRKFYERLTSQAGIKLVDFTNFDNNTFNVVTELPCIKDEEEFRPDITLLINGMPLCFIEVKKPYNREGIIAERNRMNVRFSNNKFKKFINISQILMFSNNQEYDNESITPVHGAFYGTTSTTKAFFNCFREEEGELEKLSTKLKPTNEDDENFILKDTNNIVIKHSPEFQTNKQITTPTNKLILSLFSQERLKDFLYYAIVYVERKDENENTHLEKHIMRYPQYFASKAIQRKLDKDIKRGIIWHTQGSGKTALAYYNVKQLQDYFAKKNIIPKFYFIVDRLDLKTQAEKEFKSRGLTVHTINSKSDFEKDIENDKSAISNTRGKKEITVINIQKIPPNVSVKPSDYNVNIQRVYFIDEAHRSYKETGCYFANLMSLDKNAIFISLTGTPLLAGKNRTASKDLWGDYIHQYYYNSSIADGYTLKLIREDIETQYKSKLKEVLDTIYIKHGDLAKQQIYSDERFVRPMLEYIADDMQKSRIAHNDSSIGGMVVCSSSQQAKKFFEIFKEEYENKSTNKNDIKTAALILHDIDDKEIRKGYVDKFKDGNIDILFVYNMLLTGFDAPRLKKLYIDREIKEHNLLQTLTRVNRPYNDFKYGYVVDFADIRAEFNKANKAYWEELQLELGDEIDKFSNIFKTEEEIKEDIDEIKTVLWEYETRNLEVFSQQINDIQDKPTLLRIRKSLVLAKELQNIIRCQGNTELLDRLDFKKYNELLKMVELRIADINYMEKLENNVDISELLNVAMEDIVFKFSKIGEAELKIADDLRNTLAKTREAVNGNFDKKDPEWLSLKEELERIFAQRNIYEVSQEEMKQNISLIEDIYSRIIELNRKNNLLLAKYDNDKKYARVHKRIMQKRSNYTSKEEMKICEALQDIKTEADETVLNRKDVVENEGFFKRTMNYIVYKIFNKKEIKVDTHTSETINNLIVDEYLKEYNGEVA